MSKVITLPSGATANLRDPKTLLMKDRNKVMELASKHEGLLQAVAIQNGLISVLVTEWSFDLIPPSIKVDSLGELTPADYEALAAEAEKAQSYLFPSLSESDSQDPKASTADSNA